MGKVRKGRRDMMLFLKNVGLFFLAPFIGLAYAVALPFLGLYKLINLMVERGLKDTTRLLGLTELTHKK
jgi:hypothetical protein